MNTGHRECEGSEDTGSDCGAPITKPQFSTQSKEKARGRRIHTFLLPSSHNALPAQHDALLLLLVPNIGIHDR